MVRSMADSSDSSDDSPAPSPVPAHRHHPDRALMIRIGKEELIVRRRYEAASTVNDILIALWFIAGSLMFFSSDWERTGVWCFLLGSVELMIRPAIRLARHVHLARLHGDAEAAAHGGETAAHGGETAAHSGEDSQDF